MYIAMNRFRIAIGSEQEFIEIWKNRETYLDDTPGFKEFYLLQGPSDDNCTLFASHCTWDSEQDFYNWTRSESFRKAHANTANNRNIYLGPPRFEGFSVVV